MAHLAQAAADADVVMLGNPNNPTGERLATAALHDLARLLEQRGGWLVIDEAFGDAEPDGAVAALAGTTLPRLVVLRSLGKFFGLAGARVGFVCAAAALQARLAKAIGPWAVSNPSRHVAAQALADDPWQAQQRQRLRRAGEELRTLLARHDLASSGSDLFRYVVTADATRWHSHLARHGILVRLFPEPSALRFGLPGEDRDWTRLATALETYPR